MALALLEAGIRPDLMFGTSVGAINGAALACDPSPAGARGLVELWERLSARDVFGHSPLGGFTHLARTRTALHSNAALRELLSQRLAPARTFADTTVRFQCVAASIERAGERWFERGDLIEAVLASAALPGVLPPVRIDGEHFVDGGLVNSVPIARAVAAGADQVWVLHVGHVEQPLVPPRFPWEVGFVAFEIARRHRFHSDLAAVPDGVRVHVLPTGAEPGRSVWANLRYRDIGRVADRVTRARTATAEYLLRLDRTK
jgi:NTE family protein